MMKKKKVVKAKLRVIDWSGRDIFLPLSYALATHVKYLHVAVLSCNYQLGMQA